MAGKIIKANKGPSAKKAKKQIKKDRRINKAALRVINRSKKTKPINEDVSEKSLAQLKDVSNRLQEELNELGLELSKADRYGWDYKRKGGIIRDNVLSEINDVIKTMRATQIMLKKVDKEKTKVRKERESTKLSKKRA